MTHLSKEKEKERKMVEVWPAGIPPPRAKIKEKNQTAEKQNYVSHPSTRIAATFV